MKKEKNGRSTTVGTGSCRTGSAGAAGHKSSSWNKPQGKPLLQRSAGHSTASDEIRAEMVKLLPRLQRFSYALCGNMDSGNDLAQEACLRALSRIDQWQPGTRLDSWMFRITHNIWRDRGRAAKVRGNMIDISDAHNLSEVDGRQVVEGRETLALVMKGIEQLPDDQKILIALICIDGLSYKEAAKIVEVPIGTIMSRLARARKSLHELVDDQPAARLVLNTRG